jgi:RHH-type proline utilization regulon transcriptional repressor/proline dehydrogenase/delta 1-pyrroline-5-carboxylate dehydrogenase
VRHWLEGGLAGAVNSCPAPRRSPEGPEGARLHGRLLVDGVIRPEDPQSRPETWPRPRARRARLPAFTCGPRYASAAWVAPLLPGIVVLIARRVLRGMVGHLIVDATPAKLGVAIGLSRHGAKLNVNLPRRSGVESEAARRPRGHPRPAGPGTTPTTCRSRSPSTAARTRRGRSRRMS